MAFNFSSVRPHLGPVHSQDGDTVLQLPRRSPWAKPRPQSPHIDPFLPLHPALAS